MDGISVLYDAAAMQWLVYSKGNGRAVVDADGLRTDRDVANALVKACVSVGAPLDQAKRYIYMQTLGYRSKLYKTTVHSGYSVLKQEVTPSWETYRAKPNAKLLAILDEMYRERVTAEDRAASMRRTYEGIKGKPKPQPIGLYVGLVVLLVAYLVAAVSTSPAPPTYPFTTTGAF